MKKILMLIIAFIIGMPLVFATETATEDRMFYVSEMNTYYQRSQHTYSFVGDDGVYHSSYAPSIYVLLDNKEEAANKEDWTFTDKYTIPWNTENNEYYIVYCADISRAATEQAEYRRVSVEDSTYLDKQTKERLIGILKNSYPYISVDEMKNRLLEKGILEEIEIGEGQKILAAKGNTKASRDITVDELVTATQMAINYYTDPGTIEKAYFKTFSLSGKSVLRSNNLWTNEYPTGVYTAVDNNITAVMRYLLTLSDSIPEEQKITKVSASNSKNEVYVYLNHDLSKQDNFNIIITEDEKELGTYNLSEMKTREDGSFILTDVKSADLSKISVELNGTEYVEDRLFVYEAVEGELASQTMVGISTGRIALLNVYKEPVTLEKTFIEKIENPETADIAILAFIVIAIAGIILLVVNIKKIKWLQ